MSAAQRDLDAQTALVADRIGPIADALARRLRVVTANSMGTLQLSVLVDVEQYTALRQSDLVAHEGVAPSTIGRVLGVLERRGLILRVPDPSDGRASLIVLAKEGVRALSSVRNVRDRQIVAWLGGVAPGDVDRLLSALPALDGLVNAGRTRASRHSENAIRLTATEDGSHGALAASLGNLVGRLGRRMRVQAGESLGVLQLSVLAYLGDRGETRQAELVARHNVSPATMSRVLNSLRQRRLIVDGQRSGGKRSAPLRLTTEGQRLLRAVQGKRTLVITNTLAQMPAQAVRQLADVLDVLESLAEAGRRSTPPAAEMLPARRSQLAHPTIRP